MTHFLTSVVKSGAVESLLYAKATLTQHSLKSPASHMTNQFI